MYSVKPDTLLNRSVRAQGTEDSTNVSALKPIQRKKPVPISKS